MKNQFKKLAVLIVFVSLFVGSALFMYFNYIHNKPKIKIVQPKTEVDPMKFDSLLYVQNKDKQIAK